MELIIAAIEQVGIAAFSISGAITGIRKKMDLFGVILLGIVTAVGGGVRGTSSSERPRRWPFEIPVIRSLLFALRW